MAIALYRKYRSRSLDDVVGQEHVTSLLARALESGRIAHAYLFTGPKGVGKTSIARILAHQINDLPYDGTSNHLDIIEIDAASNNGVDDIRDLRDKVQLAPSSASKKVYIIDEVHMLSKPAFNALLKTLEEPPAHVVFILATTDAEKLPETIVSRTQRYSFRRATKSGIVENLQRIAKEEGVSIENEALELIADHSDGSFRDSVSLLDQLSSLAGDTAITASMVEHSLGLAPGSAIENLVKATSDKNFDIVVSELKALEASGQQASIVARQIVSFIIAHASTYPQLLPLIDGLLGAASSNLPSASLLATLGGYSAKPSSKSAASAVASKPSERIVELEKKAHQPHPKDDIVKKAVKKITEPPVVADTPKKPFHNTPLAELDWLSVLEAAKSSGIGIHSILQKCSAKATTDGTLTLYARNAFYKKKLEAPKQMQSLHSTLQAASGKDWVIEIIPGTEPPKDSKLAQVAAMMGGGEEVSLEEVK